MPRCLMAKKWKVYPWSTTNPSAAGTATVLGVPDTSAAAIALNGAHHRLHEKLVVSVAEDEEDDRSMKKSIICHENDTNNTNNNNDDDDEEEIDVVTIQQNATDTKPIIHYQQQQHQHQQHSRHDEEATTSRTTSPIPPPTMPSNGCNNQTVIEHTPLPPQNYYQTSAEDYPPLGENQHVVLDGKLVQSSVQSGQLLPSVIQQHTSHPTPQIRLTSVIQHGASFIQTSSSSSPSSSMQQPPPGQAGMHHSASPMQPQSAWGPSSPTEGATAPSPPPHIQHSSDSDVTTIHYNGYSTASDINHYTAFLPSDGSTGSSRSYATLQSPNESRAAAAAAVAAAAAAAAAALAATNTASGPPVSPVSPSGSSSPTSSVGSSSSSSNGGGCGSPRTRSLAMCFTSTGAALSLPPKKKDIYRPYSLDDRPSVRWRPPEDLTAAHAILDLSASPPAPAPSQSLQNISTSQQPPHSGASAAVKTVIPTKPAQTKTIAYTYEAFFVSDGRSKKKSLPVENTSLPGGAVAVAGAIAAQAVGTDQRPKYTCSECGKQYATSSNLSRHKQTHRSLDSQSAKKCVTCGKAYVSMPALAMHLLTHKLNHACGICGKLFSRPWLLQGHLRSHTGEKPYGCAHCGKAFADRSNLRAHMQTHSTDKNFECTRCHKTFALKSYLNKHLESACVGDTNECSNTAISTNQVPTITHLR